MGLRSSFLPPEPGEQGPQGIPGEPGPAGENATPKMVSVAVQAYLTEHPAPAGSRGERGESGIQGPKGETGIQGPSGPPGVRGSIWTQGSGAPMSSSANQNDLYLDTSNGDVYQWK